MQTPSRLQPVFRFAVLILGIFAISAAVAQTKPAPAPKDDAPALQAQLDAAKSLNLQPKHVYHLSKALVAPAGSTINGNGATFQMLAGMPTNTTAGEILDITSAANVTVRDLIFDGNRQNRTLQTDNGTFAAGSLVLRSATNVQILVCTFRNAAMDDICVLSVNEAKGATAADASQWVTIRGCAFDGPARRQQISVVHGRFVTVTGNTFLNQTLAPATASMYGTSIDIEANPQDADGVLNAISITGNQFTNCHLAGIVNSQHNPTGVVIADNSVANGVMGFSNWANGTLVQNNHLSGMTGIGLGAGNGTGMGATTFRGNTVASTSWGFYVDAAACVMDGNVLVGCQAPGVFATANATGLAETGTVTQ